MKKFVLGIKIDDININQALQIVKGWLKKEGKYYIVTPNPEIIVMAQKDEEFKNILNKANLSIPDGIGLKLSGDIVCNTPGIDLLESIIKMAADLGYTTGFLGGRDTVAEKSAECLKKKYPKLKVSFASSAGEIDNDGNEMGVLNHESRMMNQEKKQKKHNSLFIIPDSDILFVAFGPPKQEKWIAKNLDKIPVKLAMGVGGAFDFLSGKVPRASVWIRKMGLEWLFRLIIQPWRIKRQLSLIKYIWLLLLDRMRTK